MKLLLLLVILVISIFVVLANKESWPELVGKSGDEAEQVIKDEEPSLTVQVLPNDSMVTMDYRTDRVRVFVDKEGIVTGVPRVG